MGACALLSTMVSQAMAQALPGPKLHRKRRFNRRLYSTWQCNRLGADLSNPKGDLTLDLQNNKFTGSAEWESSKRSLDSSSVERGYRHKFGQDTRQLRTSETSRVYWGIITTEISGINLDGSDRTIVRSLPRQPGARPRLQWKDLLDGTKYEHGQTSQLEWLRVEQIAAVQFIPTGSRWIRPTTTPIFPTSTGKESSARTSTDQPNHPLYPTWVAH